MPISKAKSKRKVVSNKVASKKRSKWLAFLILFLMLSGLAISVVLANQFQDLRQFASETASDSAQTALPHNGDPIDSFVNGRTEDQKPLKPGPQSRALCLGSGTDGPRFQVIYGYGVDQQNEIGTWLYMIRGAADGASRIFDDSAKKTGGRRVLRYVTTSDCQIDVKVIQLPMYGSDLDNFNKVEKYLQNQKYLAPNRNVLFFADNLEGQNDSGAWCGYANIPGNDAPGFDHASNKGGNLALLKKYCWNESVAAHEIMHNLGAVQQSAPNANGVAHCTDDYDVMCYNETKGKPIRYVCPDPMMEGSFDCNSDDYYTFKPSGYLAKHWNSAFSVFLDDPTRDAVLSLGSGSVAPKAKVSLSLSGFQPNEKVGILWNNSKVLKEVTVDGNGAFQGNVTTPDANQGQYRLVTRGSYGTYAEAGITIKKDNKKKDKKKKNNNNNNNNNKKHNGK